MHKWETTGGEQSSCRGELLIAANVPCTLRSQCLLQAASLTRCTQLLFFPWWRIAVTVNVGYRRKYPLLTSKLELDCTIVLSTILSTRRIYEKKTAVSALKRKKNNVTLGTPLNGQLWRVW